MGRKRLKLNETVFDTITEESAYWAGFILADGSILYRPGADPRISVELTSKDVSHLAKLKDFFESGHALTVSEARSAAFFSVRSLHMARSLAALGIVPRTGFGGNLALKEDRHFWRGYVDGNGCMGIYQGYPRLHVSGKRHILESFQRYVKTLVPDCKAEIRKTRTGYIYMLTSRFAREVIRNLYSDISISMDRKQKIAFEIFA